MLSSAAPKDRKTPCFVRDDDVGELSGELRFFIETFLSRRIPVSYQIIPARLTAECADHLVGLRRDHPDLIEYGQHGLRHEMTIAGKRVWREFGPERSFAEQCADIEAGLAILHDKLGGDPAIRLFTPPQHKYDGNTVKAASAAGHRLFSAAAYPSLHHRIAYAAGRALSLSSIKHHGISYHGRMRPEAPMIEMSIGVAVDNGGDILCAPDALRSALAHARRHTPVTGLMFHHAVYSTPEKRATLTALADEIAACGDFSLLSDLAAPAPQSSG